MGKAMSALLEPDGSPSRYTELELPPYRHVPGLTPHPVRHPAGHAYGVTAPVPSVSCQELPESWPTCQEYLLGVDLFNRSYLWEAHEAWELIWIGAGKASDPGSFAQALIQVSAALLRLHLGTPSGASSLLDKARSRLDQLQAVQEADSRRFMGVAIEDWWHSVERFVESSGARYPFLRLEV